jgi:hypothetical protein
METLLLYVMQLFQMVFHFVLKYQKVTVVISPDLLREVFNYWEAVSP